MVNENRRDPRIDSSAQVEIVDSGRGVPSVLADLSRGGMCLRSPEALEVGRRVGFTLRFPDGQALAGRARVRWGQPQGYGNLHGLEIEGLDWLGRQRLQKHLHPRHFGILEWADLFLQFAATVVGLLVLKTLLTANPSFEGLLVQWLPWLLTAGGVGLGFYVILTPR